MFIINNENWEIVKKTNIIGSNYKSKIDKINKGDRIIVYIKMPLCEVVGFFVVLSKYEESSNLFNNGVYAYRLKLKPIKKLEKPIDFRKLVNKMKFINNKSKWNLHLFGARGIKELSNVDFNLLFNQ